MTVIHVMRADVMVRVQSVTNVADGSRLEKSHRQSLNIAGIRERQLLDRIISEAVNRHVGLGVSISQLDVKSGRQTILEVHESHTIDSGGVSEGELDRATVGIVIDLYLV